MVTGSFRDLFVAISTAAAALTGLLFVVVTVVERPGVRSHPEVVQEVRAAAALLAFTDALAVSLFSIVPGTHVGYPAVVVGAIGTLFSVAAMRSLIGRVEDRRLSARYLVLTVFLLAVFVSELIVGVELLRTPRDSGALESLGYILVTALLIGIARAWELVGGRETGVVASLAILFGRRGSSTAPRGEEEPDGSGSEIKSETSSDFGGRD